jgi:hypothetical protein
MKNPNDRLPRKVVPKSLGKGSRRIPGSGKRSRGKKK